MPLDGRGPSVGGRRVKLESARSAAPASDPAHLPSRALIDGELEDVGAVVVTDDVERLVLLGDAAEVDLAVDDLLPSVDRPRNPRSVWSDDPRSAGQDLAYLAGGGDRPAQLEVVRQVLRRQVRADADDVAATFES